MFEKSWFSTEKRIKSAKLRGGRGAKGGEKRQKKQIKKLKKQQHAFVVVLIKTFILIFGAANTLIFNKLQAQLSQI